MKLKAYLKFFCLIWLFLFMSGVKHFFLIFSWRELWTKVILIFKEITYIIDQSDKRHPLQVKKCSKKLPEYLAGPNLIHQLFSSNNLQTKLSHRNETRDYLYFIRVNEWSHKFRCPEKLQAYYNFFKAFIFFLNSWKKQWRSCFIFPKVSAILNKTN